MPPLRLFTSSAVVLALVSVVVGFVVLVWWLFAGAVPDVVGRVAVAFPSMAVFSAIYFWMPDLYVRRDRLSVALSWLNAVGLVLGCTGIIVVAATFGWRWATATIFAGLVAGLSFVLRENVQ